MSSKQGPRLKEGMRTPANANRIADTSAHDNWTMGKEAMK